jgi:prepilin-type processing-associated H-X9-DG protein
MKIRGIQTKTDVIITLCCAVFLLSCLGAIGINGREKAKQAACAGQIYQQLQALFAYSNEHQGNLPRPKTAGNWLCDVAINTVHEMLDMGMTREMFYCPSNVNQQRYQDRFWMYNNDTWDGRRFSTVHSGSFIVSGYCFIVELNMPGSSSVRRPTITRYPGETQKRWIKTIWEKDPDSAELVIDSTMSIPQSSYPNGNFAGIPGGLYAQSQVYDTTNHLKSVGEPWGGNIGFLDGHVAWRPFKDMGRRYGSAPGFWW